MSTAVQSEMSPCDLVLSRLDGVTATTKPRHWLALCPVCKHRLKKLTITERGDGKVLIGCWKGCDWLEILAAIELRGQDTYPRDATWTPHQKHSGPNLDWRAMYKLAADDTMLVRIAAAKVSNGEVLTAEDHCALEAASDRFAAGWRLGNGG